MNVTPAQAQVWLLKNTNNRPLAKHQVAYFVKQINRDQWELTTDAIGFDSKGDLINGQHRLTAIVETGKSVELLVGEGFDEKAFNVIDTGKMRSAGDILGVNGFSAGVPKTAILRFVMGLKKGYIPVSRAMKGGAAEDKFTNQDILDYAVRRKDKIEDAYEVSTKTTKEFKGLSPKHVGGLYWLFSNINRDQALEFFHKLATGLELKSDDPIYILRKRLMQEIQGNKKSPDVDKLAWTTMAWNNFRSGKKVTKFVWSGDIESFPKPI